MNLYHIRKVRELKSFQYTYRLGRKEEIHFLRQNPYFELWKELS
jgi:hypothetical protein